MADSNLLYGTWQFNETIDINISATLLDFTCIVNKETRTYKGIGLYSGWFGYYVTTSFSGAHTTPYSNGWGNEDYRIIRISTTSASTTFMQWLQTNAVKLLDDLEYDPRTPKQKYNDLMNELSDVINNKAGTTGKKVLSQIVETAKTIKVGVTPTGTPIEVATAAEMDALLVTENIGKIYKFVGTTDDTYTNGELYQVIEEA